MAARNGRLGMTARNGQLDQALCLSHRFHGRARPDVDALADKGVDNDLGALRVVSRQRLCRFDDGNLCTEAMERLTELKTVVVNLG